MLDIAWSELLLVIAVAILVVGPKELPGALRALGRIIGKVRRTADEFRRQFEDTIRDTGAEELQREIDQLRYNNPLTEIRDTLEDAARDADQKAQQPPTLEPPAGETAPGAAETAGQPSASPSDATTTAASETGSPDGDANGATDGSGSEPRVNGEQRHAN